jgi:hypothetical protein
MIVNFGRLKVRAIKNPGLPEKRDISKTSE